eukprot:TRINITY_DN17190_c1_g1_i1.p1 TRINITY_DN17190_c1_g1~~TRINITY_DN17190_c1_g1_i1.p1  ORF type:complete len:580 (-),score=97.42 TRINITY_DN17190_c1_g1_i1:131-1870(-)
MWRLSLLCQTNALLSLLVFTANLCQKSIGIMDPSAEEKRLAWKYPDCAHLKDGSGVHKINWAEIREELHQYQYPGNMHIIYEVVGELKGSAEYDEEVRVCMLGIPAIFFYLTKYTLDTLDWDNPTSGMLSMASVQYSIFENYISALHPGIINGANWTFDDREVGQLRRQVLRAYRQMERLLEAESGKARSYKPPFKVYVYDEDEVPQLSPLLRSQIYCSRGQWGTDVQIHDFFVTATWQTDDPKEADFFFVPGYAICVLEGNLYNLDEVDQLYKDLVQALPYFNASGGRDHVFVFGSGMAHSVFQSWQDYIPEAIVLTPETELFNDFAWVAEPPFQTWKDVAIPGSLDLVEVIGALESSKPLAERRYLAAFFGRIDKDRGPHPWVGGVDVRTEIIRMKELPGTEDLNFDGGKTLDVMQAAYGDARFCFVPRGKSGWSLRFFEVIFAGCIPVVISDKWELPFEDFLDVTKFVIKWPSHQIGQQLLSYLRSLPDSVVQSYMDEMEKIRCWYFYPPKKLDVRGNLQRRHGICPEELGQDAFRGMLKILEKRLRRSKTSSKSFFFKDASGKLQTVDANLTPWY